jgi:hypothetical protein
MSKLKADLFATTCMAACNLALNAVILIKPCLG